MVGPSSQAGSSFPAGVIDGGSSSAAVSQTNGAISVNLSDSQPEQEGLLLTACGNTSVGPTVEEGGSGLGAGGVAGGGQVAVVFRERSSRVVAFELKQELDRVWAFYRGQSEGCAAKLYGLQDASASSRHQLHRKLQLGESDDLRTARSLLYDNGSQGGGCVERVVVDLQGGRSQGEEGVSWQVGKRWGCVGSIKPFGCLGAFALSTICFFFFNRKAGQYVVVASTSVSKANRYEIEQKKKNEQISRLASHSFHHVAMQEQMLLGKDGTSAQFNSKPRIRGRKAGTSSPSAGERGFAGTSPAAAGGSSAIVASTTEDPYVQATVKRSIVELYNDCNRLLSFKMLNYDACVRLVELHCRRLGVEGVSGSSPEDSSGAGIASSHPLMREKSMKMWLLEHPLFESRDLNRTLAGTELLYASLFCNGDVDVARTALTFKVSSSIRGNRRFGFGFRLGVAIVLLVWAVWDCLIDESRGKDVWHDPAFVIFRGLGNLILLVYMWGLNIWVWRRFGIDYERCLSLDPKGPRVDPCEEVWNAGCNMSIWFLVFFISFYKALRGAMGGLFREEFAHAFPGFLLCYMLFVFLIPWKERKPLLYILWTVIISPLGQVRFLEGYVGDILTSTVKVLIDVVFAVVYYCCGAFFYSWPSSQLDQLDQALAEGEQPQLPGNDLADAIKRHSMWKFVLVPMITAGPLWWRFQQNLRRSYETSQRWPHLGNALKYATAMSVSLFGMYQPGLHKSWLWMLCFVVATLYQFTWDVMMDWDLVRCRDGRSIRLRPRLLYRNKAVYVVVTVVNLGLRFLWTVTLLPENSQMFSQDFNVYMSPFIAAAEIIRRTMWGFLRVENEHLRIYDDLSSQGSDIGDQDDQVDEGCSPSSSTSAPSTTSPLSGSGSVAVAGVPVSGGGGLGGGGIGGNRGSQGLDRLPYSRMEISSGVDVMQRSTDVMKAWCFNKVQPESRRRLLLELCCFSAGLGLVALVAALSRPVENDATL
ncbi:unnamed protein product [Ascophyllum nodosum]